MAGETATADGARHSGVFRMRPVKLLLVLAAPLLAAAPGIVVVAVRGARGVYQDSGDYTAGLYVFTDLLVFSFLPSVVAFIAAVLLGGLYWIARRG